MSAPPEGIAVIGMAAVFPGAADLGAYWRNILGGVDAITEVPPARWDPLFYEPAAASVDRFYCRRGGFVDGLLQVEALELGLMPVVVDGAEPDQLATLQLARQALADAGYHDRPFARDRAAVILGRGNYIGAGMTRLEQHVRTAEQLATTLRELLPELDEGRLQEIKRDFRARLPPYGPDTAIGLVPNLTASRVANRLDLHGPAYTIDAACASSLLAVEQAMRGLRDRSLDLALVGGVHLSHDLAFWSVFTQLGALSRSGRIRPFDRRADGLLIGEGLGLLVLKRQAEAERDGDRIYAVLHGAGLASDGRGASIMNPSPAGQALAVQRAWAQAGLDPAELVLIEAHGTGTPVGDRAEVATLRGQFGDHGRGPIALGSVKSMIGHAMPAAGAAGLIKAVLALHHRVLPPSLHCEEPLAELAEGPLRVLQRPEEAPRGGRLLAGVNAFGFGGINAHLVLSTHGEGPPRRPPRHAREALLWLARPDPDSLLSALEAGAPSGGEGGCRLAIIEPSAERRDRAARALRARQPLAGRDGMYLAFEGLLRQGGRIALLCPGVEAVEAGRLPDLAAWLGRAEAEDPPGTALERRGARVVANGRLLAQVLERLGLPIEEVAGHSTGEWTGMMITGRIPPEQVDAVLAGLSPGSLEVPGVAFLSVGAGLSRAEEVLGRPLPLALTHDNCPHQVVLCGEEAAVEQARARLVEARILAHVLPFRSGFHAPFFQPFLEPHRRRLRALPLAAGRGRLWSATLAAPYPEDPAQVRELAVRHLVEPVRFRELILAMYEAGARAFVQLGAGSLVGFVSDTLRGRPHLAVSAVEPQRSGINQLQRALAALFVEGAPIDPGALQPRPTRRFPLDLGVPLIRMGARPLGFGPAAAAPGGGPVGSLGRLGEAMAGLHRAMQESAAEVQAAMRRRERPARQERTLALSVAAQPFLFDHSLIPQPPGWPALADWNPVVPMTMSVQLMAEAAEALEPGCRVLGLDEVRAHRWIPVEPPVALRQRAECRPDGRIFVALGEQAEGLVRLGMAFPDPPAALPPLEGAAPCPQDARALYSERWMFHGPAYQSVAALDGISAEGIDGRLLALPSPGALLDGAGQLLGYWVMVTAARDRLAMPVRIERIDFFGPWPENGEELPCRVRIRQVGAQQVRADLDVLRGGRLWCRILGWTDWRFETDERLWPVMQRTEEHLLAETLAPGLVLLDDRGRSSSSRDYLGRRFLRAAERAKMAELKGAERVSWLIERITARDAVRSLVGRPVFPVEIELNEGRALVEGGEAFTLALASRGEAAAALAVRGGRPRLAMGGVDEPWEALERRAGGAASGSAFDRQERGGHRLVWRVELGP